MNTTYPSKHFFQDIKKAVLRYEGFKIVIYSSWRSRIIAKEVKYWIATKTGASADGGAGKSPTTLCNLLLIPLLSMHWLALSSGYQMKYEVKDEDVVLQYTPT